MLSESACFHHGGKLRSPVRSRACAHVPFFLLLHHLCEAQVMQQQELFLSHVLLSHVLSSGPKTFEVYGLHWTYVMGVAGHRFEHSLSAAKISHHLRGIHFGRFLSRRQKL